MLLRWLSIHALWAGHIQLMRPELALQVYDMSEGYLHYDSLHNLLDAHAKYVTSTPGGWIAQVIKASPVIYMPANACCS